MRPGTPTPPGGLPVRRKLVRRLLRRRAGLLAATALLALLVPLVASAPVRAIPAVAAVVASGGEASLGSLLPWTGIHLAVGPFLGLLVVLGVAAAGMSLLQGMLAARLNAQLAADVRIDLAAHLLRQPPSYHQRAGAGTLLGPLVGDTEMIAVHLGNLLPAAFGVASGAVAWTLTLALGLSGAGLSTGTAAAVTAAVLGTLGAANVAAAWLTGGRAGRSQVRVQAARDAAIGAMAETLEGVEEIQSHGAEADESARLAERLRELARRQQVVAGWGALGNSLTQVVVIAAVPGLVAAVTLLGAPIAALAVVLPSLAFLQAAVGSATGLWNQVRLTRPSLERVGALLEETPAIADAPGAAAPGALAGRVRFEEVRFAYPGSDRAVLDGVTFEAPAGRTTAIVGDGGSGKSTLLRLLVRFLEPEAGRIRVDDHDVRDLPLGELRRRVALLGQHAKLFARSVRENLRMGAPAADEETIEEACRTANASPVVAKLEGGLETAIAPGAANLSGSERRRLALARVLARRPSVILLDEPEAGLPQAMAERLMADVRRATAGRTCLVVTHRPDLLESDTVVFLLEGRVAATAPHAELERVNEAYRALLAQRRAAAEEKKGADHE